MTQRSVVIIKIALWAACLAPFGLLVLQAFGYAGGLGANAVEQVLNVCGKTGLNLLMLTLCITPIRRSTGINKLVVFRRLLGLFAFFYLATHFLTYALLDLGLIFTPEMAWATLLVDIAERPYITVGFTALVLLVPLAVTSTRGMQRRLGRWWAKLHRLVYVVAVLGIVHYYWQVKSDLDFAQPLLYAFLLAVLLGVRLQHRLVHAKPAVPASYPRVEPPQAQQKSTH
ncbi:MAG: sulfoxide reductase heme-binding subunit YedZ [Lysobacterales bacterium]|nr:MAG: sulfoxide reductase heme-binding subunit YedZ [Xanthomonadales bacterium]